MKRFFIQTFGCQMNVADSQRMGEALGRINYTPAVGAEDADLIIINTCSVREKAEDKLVSSLGRLRHVKAQRGALIGVTGCVAQQEKAAILKKAPYVDFVIGPDAQVRLDEIVAKISAERAPIVDTAWADTEEYLFAKADPAPGQAPTAFVTVMKGCDNVCAFCVVPHTRGREVSRPSTEVIDEVTRLAAAGVREVTLLGQNVNSYRGGVSFGALLLAVARVDGIARVRFTTSHPHDLSDELIAAIGAEPRIMPHFHLPVQSGSDPVLKRMRRDYTIEGYRARLERLREARPGIAVTTDIIVGFPGETDEDFAKTYALCEAVRYDGVYAFAYSRRPRTVAALKEDEWGVVPHDVKLSRLNALIALQRRISTEEMRAFVGRTVEVLVEGPSRTNPARLFGKTPHNRTVNFAGSVPVGALATIEVQRTSHSALTGVLVSAPRASAA